MAKPAKSKIKPAKLARPKPWILMLRFREPEMRERIVDRAKEAGDEHPAAWARRLLTAELDRK